MSAREEFEAWRQRRLDTLERERERLSGRQREPELSAVERKLTTLREAAPDATPYGPELARRVARRLEHGAGLAFSHRDYCGMGLLPRDGGGFVYTSVVDGGYAAHFVRQSFEDGEALVAWLSRQSDLSLSEYGDDFTFLNQTLDRGRLEDFAGD